MKLEFELGKLPFDTQDFEPKLSAQSFAYHYNKHHKTYVENLSQLLDENIIAEYKINIEQSHADSAENFKNKMTVTDKTLIEIVKSSYKFAVSYDNSLENVFDPIKLKDLNNNNLLYQKPWQALLNLENDAKTNDIDTLRLDSYLTLHKRIFNNAAQHWNHAFFWESISVQAQAIPSKLAVMIEKKWHSIEEFNKCFYNNGAMLFGSGWVWLIYDKIKEELNIIQTINAETPILSQHLIPLLVCDAWEHAYYIDYRNKRVDYLAQIIPQFNWQFAQENLDNII